MELRFCTLGQFTLSRDGQVVPRAAWGTHRAAMLCRVLLTYRHTRLHKEQIQDWIWPHAGPDAAARNLRVALSELRRIVEPQRGRQDTSHFIENGGDTIRLNCEGIWIDSHELLLAAQPHPNAATLETLRAAADLYQGIYLPDDLYADWAQVERERLAIAYETVLSHLAEAYAQRQRPDEALHAVRQALVAHPTSERLTEQAMRFACVCGDPAQALAAYDRLVAALAGELGVAPSAPLTQMADDIRTGHHPTAVAAAALPPLRPAARHSAAGRADELLGLLEQSQQLLAEIEAAVLRMRSSRHALNVHAAQARQLQQQLRRSASLS